jgi:hypothetical protein
MVVSVFDAAPASPQTEFIGRLCLSGSLQLAILRFPITPHR